MWWWLSLGALAACGFSGARGTDGDDALPFDAAVDSTPGGGDAMTDADPRPDAPGDAVVDGAPADAAPDAPVQPACKSWSTDFASDPTTTDGPSGMREWRMRDGGAIDGTVANGTWKTNGPSGPLDTTPLNDFEGLTTVDVRMKDLSMNSGGLGAVVWVNAGFADGIIAPVIMALDKTGPASQTFTLYVKPNNDTLDPLHVDTSLSSAFQELHLEVDTVAGEIRHSINGGSEVTSPLTQLVPNTTDKFVTAIGYRSDAEFDSISVTSCAPP